MREGAAPKEPPRERLISSTALWTEQECKEGAGSWPATERELIALFPSQLHRPDQSPLTRRIPLHLYRRIEPA